MSSTHELSTLCLINGKILTLDPRNPRAEAVMIRGALIIGVGSSTEMRALCNETTQVIDLAGKTVLPGFTDCHNHILTYGIMLNQLILDLKGTKSIEDIKEKVRNEVNRKARGVWIVGGGWYEKNLAENRFLTRDDLDEAAPDNPVCLIRVCTHNVVVNSKALELANITEATESPPGGRIDKDSETNKPTGILRETAATMVRSLISFDEKELLVALKAACEVAVSKGLTAIHCLPVLDFVQAPQWRTFQNLLMRDELPLRIYHMVDVSALDSSVELGLYTGFGHPKLKIGAIKIFLDGALGSRTAALLDPYCDSDDPSNRGILIYQNEEQFLNLVKTAHCAGFQLAIHCIGDNAVTMALNAIEAALEEYSGENSRHRIEHASVLHKELISRMSALGVVASVQPSFIASDGDWVSDRVGEERAQYVYPFKTMLDAGLKLAAGSDCPTEAMNPLPGIQAAVTRITTAGNTFVLKEQIPVEQAIKMYTLNAAYASFEEHIKGSIELGKLADLVILSENPLEVPPNQLGAVEVEMTIVGGEIVYSKKMLE